MNINNHLSAIDIPLFFQKELQKLNQDLSKQLIRKEPDEKFDAAVNAFSVNSLQLLSKIEIGMKSLTKVERWVFLQSTHSNTLLSKIFKIVSSIWPRLRVHLNSWDNLPLRAAVQNPEICNYFPDSSNLEEVLKLISLDPQMINFTREYQNPLSHDTKELQKDLSIDDLEKRVEDLREANRWRDQKEGALKSIKARAEALASISSELDNNKDFILDVLWTNPACYDYLKAKWKDDPDILYTRQMQLGQIRNNSILLKTVLSESLLSGLGLILWITQTELLPDNLRKIEPIAHLPPFKFMIILTKSLERIDPRNLKDIDGALKKAIQENSWGARFLNDTWAARFLNDRMKLRVQNS